MKTHPFILLIVLLTFSGCKKENNANTTAQNIIEFDLDGVHYSLTPSEASVTVDSLEDGTFKSIQITCPVNSIFGLNLIISEDVTNSSTDCIATGNYPGIFFSDGCIDSTMGNCRNFSLVYMDSTGLFGNEFYYDSLSYLNISSCSGTPARIEGTFRGDMEEVLGSSSIRHITNGKIRGVTYTRP